MHRDDEARSRCAALSCQRLEQVTNPEDSLRVEAVDALVEDQRCRIAEQGVTVPRVGASSPMIILIVVDLPAPFGPRNPGPACGRTLSRLLPRSVRRIS
jgi:hypothetical protein